MFSFSSVCLDYRDDWESADNVIESWLIKGGLAGMPALVRFAVAWQLSRVCSPVGPCVDVWWRLCRHYLVEAPSLSRSEEGFLNFATRTHLRGYSRTSKREFTRRSVVFGTGELSTLRLAS